MNIFDLLDHIKTDHGIQTFLDGEKSLKRLRSFLLGYLTAASEGRIEIADEQAFNRFNDWISSRLGFAESTSGWCNMISLKAGSDHEAFDLFFRLLDTFRNK